MTRLKLIFCFPLLSLASTLFAVDSQPLTLQMAWARVQQRSPTLSAAYSQVGVKQAEFLQAGTIPNPLFAVVGENNADCDQGHSWAPDTVTCSISQPIELGGKRALRTEVAEQFIHFADWEEEAIKLDLYYRVVAVFLNVMAEQERIKNYEKQLEIAKEIHKAATERVSENRLGILAQYKADVLIRTCNAAHVKACRAFELAKRELVTLWRGECPDFEEVCYPFYTIDEPAELCLLTYKLQQHPNIVKWNYQIEAAHKAIALEKAQRIPDVVVTAGVRNQWWERSTNTSLLVGFAVPLPIFDRNQGNIDKAEHLCCQAQSQQEEALLEMKTELIGFYEDWRNAYDAVSCIKNTILPQAQLAMDTAQEGYVHGKYEFYDLLDSQQTLFTIYEQYVESLIDYHLARNNTKRLTCYQEIYE